MIARRTEACDECGLDSDERHSTTEQSKRQYARWRRITWGFFQCGTCQTWLGIDCLGGGLGVMGDYIGEWLWSDYGDWWQAGGPPLHGSRSTRVPIPPKLVLFGLDEPDSAPAFEVREVPHEWRP